MTLDEFNQKAACYARRSVWAVIGPIGIALVLTAVYIPFADNVARIGEPMSELWRLLPMLALFLSAFGAMVPLTSRVERECGAPCPHCTKPLHHHRFIVVASKNCPYCGDRVIECNGASQGGLP